MKNLKILVRKCVAEHDEHRKLMLDINHAQLVQGIKEKEEKRTQKLMVYNMRSEPRYLKEIFRIKHTERQIKNVNKREVRENHRAGIADPGNLAKKLEQRMFFKEYIKTDDTGHKKHIVD